MFLGVRIMSSDKPRISKELKQCLNEKKAVFFPWNEQEVKELDEEFS
jgi:hypothetical protein